MGNLLILLLLLYIIIVTRNHLMIPPFKMVKSTISTKNIFLAS